MKYLVMLLLASTVITAKAEKQIEELSAAPSIGPIERNSDGKALYINYRQALNHCRYKGMRLPTAREYARFAEQMGAQGISETMKEGYSLVKVYDNDGKLDQFYFNYRGYKCPAEEICTGRLGTGWFWTSSVETVYETLPQLFSGNFGLFFTAHSPWSGRSVRCIAVR